ncbi:MAG: hypothetical protein EHM87_06820 [Burkholderiales bacterium]|nr:MAG: hypothetical protein EHM87_06820 [Burkholderiales bacterium]
MTVPIHLVACVASHGWGHLAQTIPMVAALRARLPGLRTTVRTALPAVMVRARFQAVGLPEPDVVFDDTEFGFEMHDALRVDDDASLERYRAQLAARDALLAGERDALRALRADLVLANIGWVPIAAAASLGLPAFGACSLNWADVLQARHPERADVAAIADWMREAYARADALFVLEPGMPFDRFANRVPVPPIARRGTERRGALRAALGVAPDTRVMQVAFGGMPLALDTASWRLPTDWIAVVLTADAVDGPSVRRGDSLGWSYPDLLASCDLLVAKPGYGTFAEAGFAGRDTLAVPRDDWPETPYLSAWLARHARLEPVGLEAVRAGRFEAAIAAVRGRPVRAPATGDGAATLAEAIAARLGVAPPAPGRETRPQDAAR